MHFGSRKSPSLAMFIETRAYFGPDFDLCFPRARITLDLRRRMDGAVGVVVGGSQAGNLFRRLLWHTRIVPVEAS